MTSIEIKIRLDKALETVEKKKSTILRHTNQMEKKAAILKKAEWLDISDPSAHKWNEEERRRYKTETGRDLYWDFCDYESKLSDIKSAKKKLKEAEQIAENWQKKYDDAVKRELMIANEVPEAFKQARECLVNEWTVYDIRYRDRMNEYISTHVYDEYKKIYPYSTIQYSRKTDEEFRKIEEREADAWLLNLYQRVMEITGPVTDCSRIRRGGKCLDGIVIGENGTAEVTTIDAGGYNIQRYHLRTLVKSKE